MRLTIALLAAALMLESTAMASPTQRTVFGSNRKLAMRESAGLRSSATNDVVNDSAKAKINTNQIVEDSTSATFGSKRKLSMRTANITREEAPTLSPEAKAKLNLDEQTDKGTTKFGSNKKLSQRVNAVK